MDLPRLLFGVGYQIFIVTPQMFTFSLEFCTQHTSLYSVDDQSIAGRSTNEVIRYSHLKVFISPLTN